MKPEKQFLKQPPSFWANVRAISESVGYAAKGHIIIPTVQDMIKAMEMRNLAKNHLVNNTDDLNDFGNLLQNYFQYRATILQDYVEPRLMDVKQAKSCYEKLRNQLSPKCPMPMNKQTGYKKSEAYLTCLVNMIIEANSAEFACNYDPRVLTTITSNNAPIRTLARRVDGAFPSTVNPIAIWEIKEYYYTTTFGSRVADGVYETLLDGMELFELQKNENIKVLHYLMVDSHKTWWEDGKSYLCRILDTLHMGYIDEVLFGYEVVELLPAIVKEWVQLAKGAAKC